MRLKNRSKAHKVGQNESPEGVKFIVLRTYRRPSFLAWAPGLSGRISARKVAYMWGILGKIGQDWASWGQLGSNFGQIGGNSARLGQISSFPRVYPSPGQFTPLQPSGKSAGHFYIKSGISSFARTFA